MRIISKSDKVFHSDFQQSIGNPNVYIVYAYSEQQVK